MLSASLVLVWQNLAQGPIERNVFSFQILFVLCVKAWAFKQLLDYSEYLASLGAALLGVVQIGGRAVITRLVG